MKSPATTIVIDRRLLLPLIAAAPVLAFDRTAAAQAPLPSGWPSRVVKLVVPFTPGGGIDGIGRILGARLSEMWGQQVWRSIATFLPRSITTHLPISLR